MRICSRNSLIAYLATILASVAHGQQVDSPVQSSTTAETTSSSQQSTAQGFVFHDKNENKSRDNGEPGLAGVRVSNGVDVVTTDGDGAYQLPVTDDTILFVIKPRGWRTPVSSSMLPRFYYIHKPHGSPEQKYDGVAPTGPLPDSVDFPLYPQREPDKFRVILFGDPQPRTQQEVDYIAHDVVEGLGGSDAAFGVTLGDIVFDDLSLFESESKTIAVLGIPWYNVIGNHDINSDAQHDRHSDETFERVYGPSYYSFDYGPAHFLVLDDIEWFIENGTGKGKYRGGIGNNQLTFIRNDLAGVPEQTMVVLLMHIPIMNVRDRQHVYRLIEKRPFCISISGHTHTHEHHFIAQKDGWQGPVPHHHIVNVTVCGSWWKGAPDERGIPHATMADGAPNGHSVITFDGHQYVLDFVPASRDQDYQMEIMAPESVSQDKLQETKLHVNVFNGSERSKVTLRIDDSQKELPLKRVAQEDPNFRAAYDRDLAQKDNDWIDLPKPGVSTHIWTTILPADLLPGTHLLRIHAVDMHGRSYHSRRVIRVIGADK